MLRRLIVTKTNPRRRRNPRGSRNDQSRTARKLLPIGTREVAVHSSIEEETVLSANPDLGEMPMPCELKIACLEIEKLLPKKPQMKPMILLLSSDVKPGRTISAVMYQIGFPHPPPQAERTVLSFVVVHLHQKPQIRRPFC